MATPYLNLRLREPDAYETMPNGGISWDMGINFQTVDAECSRTNDRLKVLEAQSGNAGGAIDVGTF
jgi:hypothetical protein